MLLFGWGILEFPCLVIAWIALSDGKFGAYMQVHIQNDGPVTIELESPASGAATSDPKQVSQVCLLGACNIFTLWFGPWTSTQSEVEKTLYFSNLIFILVCPFPRMHVSLHLPGAVKGWTVLFSCLLLTLDSRENVLCRARFFIRAPVLRRGALALTCHLVAVE